MRYWDPSAMVPMLAAEAATHSIMNVFEQDQDIVTWWGSVVECTSAIARRDRSLSPAVGETDTARFRLRLLQQAWQEIGATEDLRQTAMRLLRTHPLRTGDALQLAAAIIASEGRPGTLVFVTLDDRLAEAADKEGFPILRPGA